VGISGLTGAQNGGKNMIFYGMRIYGPGGTDDCPSYISNANRFIVCGQRVGVDFLTPESTKYFIKLLDGKQPVFVTASSGDTNRLIYIGLNRCGQPVFTFYDTPQTIASSEFASVDSVIIDYEYIPSRKYVDADETTTETKGGMYFTMSVCNNDHDSNVKGTVLVVEGMYSITTLLPSRGKVFIPEHPLTKNVESLLTHADLLELRNVATNYNGLCKRFTTDRSSTAPTYCFNVADYVTPNVQSKYVYTRSSTLGSKTADMHEIDDENDVTQSIHGDYTMDHSSNVYDEMLKNERNNYYDGMSKARYEGMIRKLTYPKDNIGDNDATSHTSVYHEHLQTRIADAHNDGHKVNKTAKLPTIQIFKNGVLKDTVLETEFDEYQKLHNMEGLSYKLIH
jgi:hypothetical protein